MNLELRAFHLIHSFERVSGSILIVKVNDIDRLVLCPPTRKARAHEQ